MSPAWSVIIPYYNEAAFLPRTLSSIIAQDLRPFRLILVDNGSTDDSERICRTMTRQCNGITTVHLNDQRPGQVNALQSGINEANTQLIAICDADTYYPSHYLRHAQTLFEQSPAHVGAIMATGIYSDPDSLSSRFRRAKSLIMSTILPKQCHTGGYGHTFRSEVLKSTGGYSKQLWGYVLKDHELMHRILKTHESRYAFRFWCMPSPRRHNRSNVRWSLFERLLYHATHYRLKDWYFYRFLGPRLAKRQLDDIRLRQREWERRKSS